MGWPPIKSWRKKLMHRHQQAGGGRIMEDPTVERGSRGSNPTYVEVRMAGARNRKKDRSTTVSFFPGTFRHIDHHVWEL